jgi:hypothetical protein
MWMMIPPPAHGTFRPRRGPKIRTGVVDPARGVYRIEVTITRPFFERLIGLRPIVRTMDVVIVRPRTRTEAPVFKGVRKCDPVIGPGQLGYVQLLCRSACGAFALD